MSRMIVVTADRRDYGVEVRELRTRHDALVFEVAPGPADGRPKPKVRVLLDAISWRHLKLRRLITSDDEVIVLGMHLVALLVLIRLHWIKRPRTLTSVAFFIHDERIRRVAHLLVKVFQIPELRVVTFSEADRAPLITGVGLPAEHVVTAVYHFGPNREKRVTSEGTSIFTGGFTNRDYPTFLAATRDMPCPVVIVASERNAIPPIDDPNVFVHLDVDEQQFDALLAESLIVALPLYPGGEACGQSVLLRAMQLGKATIATRHPTLLDYLGDDYPGFVPAGDSAALRAALLRAVGDAEFRAELVAWIERCDSKIADLPSLAEQIAAVASR